MDLNYSNRWWNQKNDPHTGVMDAITNLSKDYDQRKLRFQELLSIYYNKVIPALEPQSGLNLIDNHVDESSEVRNEEKVVINASAYCTETLAARIASHKPRATFQVATDGPDAWELYQRSDGLEKFVAGEWQREKVYKKSVKCFFDGAVLGLGAMKALHRDGKIGFERTPPWQLLVDERAAAVTEPRTMYQIMHLPTEVLKAEYSQKGAHEAIERATIDISEVEDRSVCTVDLVRVIEAWHLPSSDKSKDGRHIICIDGFTFVDEKWELDHFPFAFFFWNEPLYGFYPQSAVEQVRSIQTQLNKLWDRVQVSVHLNSVAKIYAEEGSLVTQKLRNRTGDIILYKKGRKAPETLMPGSISSEVFKLLDQLEDKVRERLGVSQMSAQSIKPPGLESGRALRVMQSSETGRHALTVSAWDGMFIQLAELTVDFAKMLNCNKKSYSTTYSTRSAAERVDFSKVDMDRDKYVMQVFPSSMLPHEPAGRLAAVEELIEAGFVTPDQGQVLLDIPDLDQFASLKNATHEIALMQIGEILCHGKKVAVEPFQDIRLTLKLSTAALLRSKMQGAPDDRRKMLAEFINNLSGELKKIQELEKASQPAPPMPPQMPPQGVQ